LLDRRFAIANPLARIKNRSARPPCGPTAIYSRLEKRPALHERRTPMNTDHRLCYLLLSLALLSTAVTSVTAQAPVTKAPADQPAIKSHVRVVLVDVVVTRDKGEPVLDLRKEDFQIIENGKPQIKENCNQRFKTPAVSISCDGEA